MLTIIIILFTLIVLSVVIQAAKTKEFNPLFFTLDKEVQEAEKRGVKPCIEPTPIPKRHIVNYYIDWIIVITVIAILFSCSSMKTGYYEIKEIRGNSTVVFKELPNDAYHVPRADTLKVGQRIHLKRVFREQDADVW